jgi:hypothetical protein
MTIEVELSPETEAWLAAQAASRSMEIPAYAASLLEQAKHPAALESCSRVSRPRPQRPAGRKNLAQLFAESPVKGLNLEFERDGDFGRDITLRRAFCWIPTSLPS